MKVVTGRNNIQSSLSIGQMAEVRGSARNSKLFKLNSPERDSAQIQSRSLHFFLSRLTLHAFFMPEVHSALPEHSWSVNALKKKQVCFSKACLTSD
jgi:hypothetical protein